MTDIPVLFRVERSGEFKGELTAVFPTHCEIHDHTWEPDGTRSGGCIGLRCAICGAEDEKDVS
jgi:hypothetical protein